MRTSSQISYKPAAVFAVFLLALAFALAWVSSRLRFFIGWPSFAVVFLIGVGLVWLCWRMIRAEAPPRSLLVLMAGAAVLRLALGVFWYLALPVWGYDTPVQDAGYVMEDAYARDSSAWKLSISREPLIEAFQGYSTTDQYGGLLFLSAAVYRYLGVNFLQPLLMLTICAFASALSVGFSWAWARRLWGERVGWLSAWLMALYPEAVLLGSSQMREAFLISLVPAALYQLERLREARTWKHITILLLLLLIGFAFSTPLAAVLLVALGLVWLARDEWKVLRRPRLWVWIVGLAALCGAFIWWNGGVQDFWVVQSAELQKLISANSSGWIEREFRRLPEWAHIPFLLAYGVFRPLLPAALVADGALLWRAVAIWRALGWTITLGLIAYAAYLALREREWHKTTGALLILNLAIILIASYRGGGDDWDNPRYRTNFAALQIGVAAWAWVRSRELADPWLRRAAGMVVAMVAWFIPWYLRRYIVFEWSVVDLFRTVGLGLATGILYMVWDWAATKPPAEGEEARTLTP